MGSTGSERSLSSGLIPQWMKSKIDTRMDLDETMAFSPPDDSFFFVRYSTKSENVDGDKLKTHDVGYRPISEILKQHPVGVVTTNNNNNITPKVIQSNNVAGVASLEKVPNFAQHTVPCQQYIAKPDIPKLKQNQNTIRIKSAGTDDGFKGEGAACGTSIIQVANQMVSSGKVSLLQRGGDLNQTSWDETASINTSNNIFSSNNPLTNTHNVHPDDRPPTGFNAQLRRGSKSLPTTPLTSPAGSPRSRRKHNRYFTGAFVDGVNNSAEQKYQGSWILAGLLGTREVLSRSTTTIAEEQISHSSGDSKCMRKAYSKVEVNNVNMEDDSSKLVSNDKLKQTSQLFRPKPSELREMNFWSPTSM